MLVNVVNLKRYFGTTRAVDGLTFSFSDGQIYGFVGPNGAGKTTTMRIMATLDEPSSGDVYINGTSVVQYPETARKMMGFVPDSLPTHRDMTVHEYIDFFARAYGIRGAKRRSVVDGVEEFTNLMGIREKFLKALSKGMKQRVNLARALIHDPPVLVMDEPAAGLDPRARVELRELVKVLASQGKAVFISSHILTELAEMVDGVIIIEQGRMLHAGGIRELRRRANGCTVLIRPLDDPAELQRDLLLMPGVQKVNLAAGHLRVHVEGEDDHCSALLAQIVQKGHRIAEFRQESTHLEDVFMSMTKGEVQ